MVCLFSSGGRFGISSFSKGGDGGVSIEGVGGRSSVGAGGGTGGVAPSCGGVSIGGFGGMFSLGFDGGGGVMSLCGGLSSGIGQVSSGGVIGLSVRSSIVFPPVCGTMIFRKEKLIGTQVFSSMVIVCVVVNLSRV